MGDLQSRRDVLVSQLAPVMGESAMRPQRYLAAGAAAAAMMALAAHAPAAGPHRAAASLAQKPQPVKRPQRIVSLNLCSDQYLVELADRDQIAGLSRNAADPQMSAVASRVGGIHILRDSAEDLLVLKPDLVLGLPAYRGGMLKRAGLADARTVDLTYATTYAGIVAEIRQVALAVGHPARGEALIARMNRDLAVLPRGRSAGVAADYQRRGYLTGTGTLIDELMTRAGLTNLAGKLGKPALSQMSLEELIAARPDYLIVEAGADRVRDQGTEMLHHPLLKDIPRLRLPEAWTVCGGPAYVNAARSLAAQIAKHRQPARH